MKSENSEKIGAVIVTYNRKNLLKECIEAILNQTRLVDAIFIVDNASTDGTPEFLMKDGYIKEIPPQNLNNVWEKEFNFGEKIKVFYIRLPKNEGGAGGFYEGIKRAYEKWYTWIWPMDDDGIPERNCLEVLLETAKTINLKVVCPIIINKFDKLKERLAFPDKHFKTLSDLKKISKNRLIPKVSGPFLGSILHCEVIEKVGYPEKQYFIYGDEVDFFMRIKKKYKYFSDLNAIFLHPPAKLVKVAFPSRPFYIFWTKSDLRNYYFLRNNAILFRKYKEWKSLFDFLKDLTKYLIFFIFFGGNKLKNLKIFGYALFYGLQKKFVVPKFLENSLYEK